MENPPVNYNPNESLFNGGTDSSIMKVMGGGGESPPANYNENQSLLEVNGGDSIPIEMIKGGGNIIKNGGNDVMIVRDYIDAEEEALNSFINILTPNVKRAIRVLERKRNDIEVKYNSSFLKYKIIDHELVTSAVNTRNIPNQKKIVFIPLKTKTIIVLPPMDSAIRFLNVLDFLLNSNYIIVERNVIKIKRNVFIVGLTPFNLKDENLYYLYLHLKVANFESYFIVNEPYTILYPSESGILFTSKDKKLEKPIDDTVLGINIEEIQRYGIKKMSYVSGS
jgi:hypothetical protein